MTVPVPATLRRGCTARGWKLAVRYAFAPDTVEAASTTGMVWINVGSGVGSGVVNFRSPSSGVRGSCECVVRLQSELYSHVFSAWDVPGAPIGPTNGVLEVTVCLSRNYKSDDAAAVFLVEHLLQHGSLPAMADVIAAYMAWGRRSAEPYFRNQLGLAERGDPIRQEIETLAASSSESKKPAFSLMLALEARHLKRGSSPSEAEASDHLRSMVELMRQASAALDSERPKDARAVDSSRDGHGPLVDSADARKDVQDAMNQLLVGLSRVSTSTCPARLCGEAQDADGVTVDALLVECPPDFGAPLIGLLRLAFAAGLGGGSPRPALIVLHGPKSVGNALTRASAWYDISIAANHPAARGASLRGLGLLLESMEQYARGGIGDSRRALHGRYADIPGIADPWYDGRDHEYQLVGSPRGASGSELTIDGVGSVIAEAYWLPAAHGIDTWRVGIKESGSNPGELVSLDRCGIYKPRVLRSGALTSAETWTYPPSRSTGGCMAGTIQRDRRSSGSDCSSMPLSGDILQQLTGGDSQADYRIVMICLSRPPLVAVDVHLSVEDCVPPPVRNRWRSVICGPGPKTVELDSQRMADIGPNGTVVWVRPGSDPTVSVGHALALAALDILAYRSDLTAVMRGVQGVPASADRSSSSQLEDFVRIVGSYQPERTTTDLRRACAAIEDSLSIPSVVERLERILQFSDERARIRHDQRLQLLLLVLAVPAVIQTPADLIQAWGAWEGGAASAPGPLEFWGASPGLWVLGQVGVLVVATIAIGLVVRSMASHVRRWSIRQRRTGSE